MPTGMQSLDTGFPSFSDNMNSEEKTSEILSYLFSLLESLKYVLSNLGAENFNSTELGNITSPILGQIADVENNLMTIKVTADSAKLTASNALGKAQSVELTVDGFTVTNAQGQTTIDGDFIQSGTIKGATLISDDGTSIVQIENGTAYFTGNAGETNCGITGSMSNFKIWSTWPWNIPIIIQNTDGEVDINAYIVKLNADGNASFDAGSGCTLYIGTSNSGETINIGSDSATVNIIGNVNVNGVPYSGAPA